VEPDISVICDPGKLDEKGCNGAPDWIIEIISPSTAAYDYFVKSAKYQAAGVKEYWIVNPVKEHITVYQFNAEDYAPEKYTFHETIKVGIYDDFEIDFNELL
jgi:Uma2 family endonuclease